VACTLDERLGERTIPSFEISSRFDAVILAIKTGDTAAFTGALVRWLSAAGYLGAHRTEVTGQGLVTPEYGVIPDLEPEQRRDSTPSEAAIAAVRALTIYSIITDRQLSATELVVSLQPELGEDHPAVKLLSCLEKADPYIEPTSSSTAVLSNLAAGAPRTPEDSLIASIHLLELTSQLGYRRILEEPVARWIAAEWTKVAHTQQFAISSPRINGPAILEAVARSNNDLVSSAKIILAGLPAVKTRIHPRLRLQLEEIRNGVPEPQ
jgi:hypothetical protein